MKGAETKTMMGFPTQPLMQTSLPQPWQLLDIMPMKAK